MKILLDTCAFLWLTTDAPELSDKAKILFQNTSNAVYLSSVSVWEIIVKHQMGKLPYPVRQTILLNNSVKNILLNIYLSMKKQYLI